MGIGKYLKHEGHNLRERLNIYSGTLLGAAVPVIALRYLMFQGETAQRIPGGEIAAWVLSFLGSCIIPPHFSPKGLAIGAVTGIMCARQLRRERTDKKLGLEGQV